MTDGREVNAYLVCSPGFKPALNQRTPLQPLYYLIVGNGVLSTLGILWMNRLFLAVRVLALDPSCHRSGSRDRMPVADGEIGPLQVVGGALPRQHLMRSNALGDDKQSRSIH